jgi:hypothetical protein
MLLSTAAVSTTTNLILKNEYGTTLRTNIWSLLEQPNQEYQLKKAVTLQIIILRKWYHK